MWRVRDTGALSVITLIWFNELIGVCAFCRNTGLVAIAND